MHYDFSIDDIRLSDGRTVIQNSLTGGSVGQICSAREVTGTGGNGSLGLTDTWYHYDHIGNVMNFSNSSGALVSGSIQHQDAWGNVLASATTGAWASSFSKRHLTTKEYDSDGELHYFFDRWLDSQNGVFISRDRLSIAYRYDYCDNPPVDTFDPDGRKPIYEDPSTHIRCDLNWPTCAMDSLRDYTYPCSDLDCDQAPGGGALANAIMKMLNAALLNMRALVPKDIEDLRKRATGSHQGGIPYFNPDNPHTGGDFCVMACVCAHEWTHVVEHVIGLDLRSSSKFAQRVIQSMKEFSAYAVEMACNPYFLATNQPSSAMDGH